MQRSSASGYANCLIIAVVTGDEVWCFNKNYMQMPIPCAHCLGALRVDMYDSPVVSDSQVAICAGNFFATVVQVFACTEAFSRKCRRSQSS